MRERVRKLANASGTARSEQRDDVGPVGPHRRGSQRARGRTPTLQEKEAIIAAHRRHFQQMKDRELSHLLTVLAHTPNRLHPLERRAALMTAASRLWRADGDATRSQA